MLKEILKDKGFVAASIILLLSALGIDAIARKLQITFVRKPVPLKKSLHDFDYKKLYPPYKMLKVIKLESDIVEALGTDEYLHILFDDTSIDPNNPGKYVSFFVTYYTGSVDQVPHVPDVCYQGGGYDPIGADNTYLIIPQLGLPEDKLPVRVLLFRDTKSTLIPQIKPVIYFFSVNGRFRATRNEVRLALADIREKYAYFSKVEIAFIGIQPTKEEALKLTEKFLKKALPVLLTDHWQDWQEFTGNK